MKSLVFSLLVPLLLAGLAWSIFAQKYRSYQLERRAAELGFSFRASSDYSLDETLPSFELFQRGTSRHSYNVWTRRDDPSCCQCGDFSFHTRSSVGRTATWKSHRMSYCVWKKLPCQLPANLVIRPEGFLDDVLDLLRDDIDFARRKVFSEMYHVASDEPSFARTFVSSKLIDLLLASPGASLDWENGSLLIAAQDDVWTPDEMQRYAELGQKLIAFTKEFCDAPH